MSEQKIAIRKGEWFINSDVEMPSRFWDLLDDLNRRGGSGE